MICGKYSKNVLKNDLVSYLTFDFTYPTFLCLNWLFFYWLKRIQFFQGQQGAEREVCWGRCQSYHCNRFTVDLTLETKEISSSVWKQTQKEIRPLFPPTFPKNLFAFLCASCCWLGIFHCYMEYAALKGEAGANVTIKDLGFQTDFTVYLQIRQTWLAFSQYTSSKSPWIIIHTQHMLIKTWDTHMIFLLSPYSYYSSHCGGHHHFAAHLPLEEDPHCHCSY